MYIYNVTTQVSSNIHTDWLAWMKQVHIPAVMASGCFSSFQIVRLLDIDEAYGPTYAVQYRADSSDHYERYIHDFAPNLRKESMEHWGKEAIAFRTLMQVVN